MIDTPWEQASADCEYIINRKTDGGHYKHSKKIRDFIEDMKRWIDERHYVSIKQLESIEKIKNFGR